MAASIEEKACETMRKNLSYRAKLLRNQKVEVRSIEDGFQGSWHSGTVIYCDKGIREVQYDYILSDEDNSKKLVDCVEASPTIDGIISTKASPSGYRGLLRPLPPPLDCDVLFLRYGQCVDVFYQDAWWEGVIFDHQDGSLERTIFFPDMGDEMKVHIGKLRITQEWDEFSDIWKPRGNWLYIEIIKEIEKDWPLLVSVKQIWYDIRVKDGFNYLKEWTSPLSNIWKELVLQVIVENFNFTVKEFLNKLNCSGELGQEDYEFQELSESAIDAILKDTTYFGDLNRHELLAADMREKCLQPWDEKIDGDNLASFMGKGNFDKIPLASPICPNYEESPCANLPELAIVPSTPKELSREGSCINFEGSSSIKLNMFSQRKRKAWIPAGPDIVPEYCADAIDEYYKVYHMHMDRLKQSRHIKLNAKKHLSFLGWKIESKNDDGIPRVRYIQPGSGKCFSSLIKACECLRESAPNCKKLYPNSSRIPTHLNTWLPAVFPKDEFCEDAVVEYFNISTNRHSATRDRHPPSKDLLLNVRKHLSFLGWKIEYLQEATGIPRYRYTEPDGLGKCFQSLRKVCEHLIGPSSKIVSPRQDEHVSLSAVPTTSILSPLAEKSEECEDEEIEPCPSDIIIEPEYCPQAVVNYYSLGITEKGDPRKWKRDYKLKDMQLKAKKHLCAAGWRMYYYVWKGFRICHKRELRYQSPSGRTYTSLRAACKGYFNEERSVGKEVKRQLTREDLCSPLVAGKIHEKRGRKRKNSVLHLVSQCSKHMKDKKSKGIQATNSKDNLNAAVSTRVLRSSKRARQVVVPSSSHSNPRTIMSWLIDNNVVLPRAKVQYRKGDSVRAEGRVTRDGIRCSCCQYIFTLTNFEGHAGSSSDQPSANIFLDDGRSLLECQLQLRRDINVRSSKREPCEVKGNQHHNKNDYICSVCNYGGELVLCDRCPSSFHTFCLDLKEVPDGDWFCPSCCCKICGRSKISGDMEESIENSIINCHQCELRYHIGCLRMKGVVLDGYPTEYWFCNKRCEQISVGLQKLLGKPVPLRIDDLTWTLLKYIKPDSCQHDPSNIEDSTEIYSKLNVALGVMHECFEPVKEPRTRRDLVEDVIFNRWSELNRLNFQGFYTVLLEKNEELITAATVRIYGERVAEIPLVATRFLYRRCGMCRILMNELEKVLIELGVERLVLPAVPSVLDTWISSFGFSRMTRLERLKYLDYTFLDFQGTVMCQKLLLKMPCEESVPPVITKQLTDVNNENDMMDLEGSSAISEILQADRIEDSGTVDQRSMNISEGTSSDGGNDKAAPIPLENQPTDLKLVPCQTEVSLESSVEGSDFKEDENRGNGRFNICYKRRKISKPVGAEVSAC